MSVPPEPDKDKGKKVDDPIAAALTKSLEEQKAKVAELEEKLKAKPDVSTLFKDIKEMSEMAINDLLLKAFPKPTDDQKKAIAEMVKGKSLSEVKSTLELIRSLLPGKDAPTLNGSIPLPGQTGDKKSLLFDKERPSPYQKEGKKWSYIG